MHSFLRVRRFWPLALFLAYLSLFFFRHINLAASDLGRHITNGHIFLESGKIFTTNFYSYTQPDFPVTTHHWFFGVIAHLVHQLGGFSALTYLNVAMSILAVGLVMVLAIRRSNLATALTAGFLTLPLITSRTEIRPETVSMLGVAVFLYLLCQLRNGRRSLLFVSTVLIPFQVLWANTHLFFVFGPFLIGTFGLEALFQRDFSLLKKLLILGVLTSLACFVNANGLAGTLAPFTIFQEYGYTILENQSVVTMLIRLPNAIHIYLPLFLLTCFILLPRYFVKTPKPTLLRELFIFGMFGYLAVSMNRMYSFFGLAATPFLAELLHQNWMIIKPRAVKLWQHTWALAILSPVAFAIVIALLMSQLFVPSKGDFGTSLYDGNTAAAEFYLTQNLQGPIFNNYDIDGYLIYHLFPNERVFTDNRPEAYSTAHFREYIDAQLETDSWQQLQEKYQFNTIFFYRLDMTNWAQDFLIERVQDPEWAPVYVDEFNIILLKRSEENAATIQQFEIPKSVFGY